MSRCQSMSSLVSGQEQMDEVCLEDRRGPAVSETDANRVLGDRCSMRIAAAQGRRKRIANRSPAQVRPGTRFEG